MEKGCAVCLISLLLQEQTISNGTAMQKRNLLSVNEQAYLLTKILGNDTINKTNNN